MPPRSLRPSRRAGRAGEPHLLLAQAGTGIGKTLGYLAPASRWAEEASGTVWVSTYTKALQRQLRRESRRVWPAERADGSQPVVVRKGRENYLCLLNLEDALQGGFGGRAAILAQLVARWAAFTQDGDMVGGDLPGWLGTLFRARGIASLTDRRGECVYAGCPHYRKCFVERAARASAHADLVIANHALVMVNAARSGSGEGRDHAARPTRIVFDEGHHVFEAADATFAAALTGAETIELRRWAIGPERGSKGRRRGLSARLADIASYDEAGGRAIAAARAAAEALPADGWLQRLHDGAPSGPLEDLLSAVRALVHARDESGAQDAGYGLETEAAQLGGAFVELAQAARAALAELRAPLIRLGVRLDALLAEPPEWLDAAGRARIEGARHALGWRVDLLAAWEALLDRLGGPADPEFVDWLAIDRAEAREYDVGIHRRSLDPMKPFARVVLEPAHGAVLTSATLRNGDDWSDAIARSGAGHIGVVPRLSAFESPFDYASQAEVLIVTDVARGDLAALAGAYARLIEAAGGGVLGLFTAIRRLRAVHGRIADRLARAGLPLYAQHVDPIDTGTLVDIFRDDPRASLLGTDALRDGVDVPGHSLRLVVMEQVPWPRPSILHRARRAAALGQAQDARGGGAYDDRIIRARLAQAFGRLIRGSDDRGHFVVLSAAFPSRLLPAFPPGTPVRRCTLEGGAALRQRRCGIRGDRPAGRGRGRKPMKTIGLFRHAKSDWHEAALRDFDRPLTARGKRGAALMGSHVRSLAIHWDRVIASPAVRAAQTIEFADARCHTAISWDRRIYLASSATLADLLREQDGDPDAVLMVGHNPGIEDLIFDLVADDGSSPLRDQVEEKFPTGAFAVLDAEIESWSDLADNCARLVHLTRPRDLDPELGPEPA